MKTPALCFLLCLSSAPLATAQVVNLAATGAASQSSQYGGSGYTFSEAANAIDGRTDGSFWSSSCSSTAGEQGGWWRVDFGGRYRLGQIRLFNRSDCCPERFSNFRLSVEDGGSVVWSQDFYVGAGHVPPAGEVVSLSGFPTGDAVRVQNIGQNAFGDFFLTIAEVQVFGASVGTPFCSPANANSTGLPGDVAAVGSAKLNQGLDFSLVAFDLPKNQFGYMLCSKSTGSTLPPGSQGVLCLSGNIGRFKTQVQNTGPGGILGIQVDTGQLPVNPPKPALPGETWYFQAWYRDGGSSNFTDAVCVTFE